MLRHIVAVNILRAVRPLYAPSGVCVVSAPVNVPIFFGLKTLTNWPVLVF
jgi:hypothetical protein